MHPGQRFILNGTDLSPLVDDFWQTPTAFAYMTGQYAYIGQALPFTNIWFELGTANTTNNRTMSMDVWWNGAWTDVVDFYDGTVDTGSRSFGKSGRVSWGLEWDQGWDWEEKSEDVTGLSAFKIYELYWLRLSWSGSLAGVTTLKYVGQMFCSETELTAQYPDLRNTSLKTAFAPGKTDWKDQIFVASSSIVRDLKSRGLILKRGQIFDWTLFNEPAVHRTAEVIYRGMGAAYRDDAQAAAQAYSRSMKMENYGIDRSGNGRLEHSEMRAALTELKR
jgi:hypothetical protein